MKKKNVRQDTGSCADMQQEIDRVSAECEILRKKRKGAWIWCFLFLLLGIGVNTAVFYYFDDAAADYAESLEQEYNAKRDEMEQKLGGELLQ